MYKIVLVDGNTEHELGYCSSDRWPDAGETVEMDFRFSGENHALPSSWKFQVVECDPALRIVSVSRLTT